MPRFCFTEGGLRKYVVISLTASSKQRPVVPETLIVTAVMRTVPQPGQKTEWTSDGFGSLSGSSLHDIDFSISAHN